MSHVNDNDIQAWMDGENSIDRRQVDDHLRDCFLCRENVRNYQRLYRALEHQVHPFIPADFRDRVMHRLSRPFFERIRPVLEKAPFLVMGAGALFILMDSIRWESRLPEIFSWVRVFKRIPAILESPLNKYMTSAHVQASWLLIGFGVLLLTGILDQCLRFRMHTRFD